MAKMKCKVGSYSQGRSTEVDDFASLWADQWLWRVDRDLKTGYEAICRGCRDPKGKKFTVYLARAIYEKFVGRIPPGHDIHHKNGNTFDNRLANLECRPKGGHVAQHNAQQGKAVLMGAKVLLGRRQRPDAGVRQLASGRWQVSYQKTGKEVYPGTFDTKEEAIEVYRKVVAAEEEE